MQEISNIWSRMKEQSEHSAGIILPQPIVEITGDQRVLIENHLGIVTYGTEKIIVKVKYGKICICGCRLELMHMTKEQLVIFGRIQSISLYRRDNS